MSELTRRNFILDERVAGKVTLMTPTKISPDEAYQVFLSALEIKGFTAIEDGKDHPHHPVGPGPAERAQGVSGRRVRR